MGRPSFFYGKFMVKRELDRVYSGGVVGEGKQEMQPEERVIRWRDEFPH